MSATKQLFDNLSEAENFIARLVYWLTEHSELNLVETSLSDLYSIINSNLGICLRFLNDVEFKEPLNKKVIEPIETSSEDLALAYERLLGQADVKSAGSFYTPVVAVDFILSGLFNKIGSDTENFTFLDPAVGSGIFLIRLIKRLASSESAGIINRIFAIDKNQSAIELALLLCAGTLYAQQEDKILSLKNIIAKMRPNFLHANFLIDQTDIQSVLVAESENIFPLNDTWLNKKFDCIVGNPPYGLKRDQQLSETENKILLSKYSQQRIGKVNKYLLFMARARQSLSSRGYISFIVPNAWLGINAASRIRQIYCKDLALIEVAYFDSLIFEKASVEAVVFMARAAKLSSETSLKHYDRISDPIAKRINSINLDNFTNLLQGRIPLYWSEHANNFLPQIFADSLQIKDFSKYFKPAIAIQAYALGKGKPAQDKEIVKHHPFHHNIKKNENCFPYLVGKDIARYQCRWSGEFLEYGPWLAEPQSISKFNCPRIVLREVLGSYPRLLVATYLEDISFYNKSCLHIIVQEKGSVSLLKALLGILNSTVGSFIIRYAGIKSQRNLFPKLVNADLLNFPLPKNFLGSGEIMSGLVEQRLISKNADDIAQIENSIDQQVAQLYGLNNATLNQIRSL